MTRRECALIIIGCAIGFACLLYVGLVIASFVAAVIDTYFPELNEALK